MARFRRAAAAASAAGLLLSLVSGAQAAGGKTAPDADLSELLGVGLVVAQLVFHVLLHQLEHFIGHKHPSLLPVLRTLYRELLILGFVSFTFILVATFGKVSDELFVSFEFAHLLIFLLAVFYIIVVFATSWASLSLSARWQKIESMEFVSYLAFKQEYSELKAEREQHQNYVWRWCLWWKGNPFKLERYHYLHERMAFHDSRFQFLYYRGLPEDFSFSAYLRKVKSQVFRNLVEVHWTIWCALLVFIVGDYVRRLLLQSEVYDQVLIISVAVLCMIAADALRMKISRIYWRLFKRPATYFNDVTQALTSGLPLDDDAPISPRRGRGEDKLGDFGEGAALRASPSGLVHRPSPAELAREAMRAAAQEAGVEDTNMDPDDTDYGMRSTVRRSLGDGNTSKRPSSASLPSPDYKANDPLDDHDGRISPVGNTPDGSLRALGMRPPAPKAEFIDSIFSAEAEPHRSTDGAHGDKKGGHHVEEDAPRRHSLELRREGEPGRRSIDRASAGLGAGRGGGAPNGGRRRSSVDRASSDDEGSTMPARRMSLELAGNLPVGELEARHRAPNGVVESGARRRSNEDGSGRRDSASGRRRRSSLDRRGGRRSKVDDEVDHEDSAEENNMEHVNTSIIDRHQKALEASQQGPRRNYPKIVLMFFPRLARRASPAEKLFWAGSHSLFLWLEEFVLFGSTLLTAVVVAGYSTAAFKGVQKGADARDIAAIVMSLVAQAYVLFRVAQSLKLYVFVLNSSGLLDEERALAAIDRVKAGKRRLRFRDYEYGYEAHDEDELFYGDEYEEERRESVEQRRAADRERRSQLYKHLSRNAETLLEDQPSDSDDEPPAAAIQPGAGDVDARRATRPRSGALRSPSAAGNMV